ncbi:MULTISPECIES: hypothetical protein [Rhodococcus]|uniref:hypothetical protein n=1 Tax=Rhodococcus TaxID=1827 RepID=UPI0002E822AB|nr:MULTISPECIES: hypothetical protein [Rhodococcus]WAM19293.1 hypothetical protein OYT95_43080 [Rhodococcus sp. JS3073]
MDHLIPGGQCAPRNGEDDDSTRRRIPAPELADDEAAGERVQRWEQMLSTTHLPWSVTVPDDTSRPFDAYVRRW